MRARLFLPLLLLAHLGAAADEGMWTLDNFPADAVEERYGANITAAWLQRVQASIARLDGGCTGSFVSPDGLVLTNNHCVWGCVRNLSSADENLSELGFLASTREQERVCPGMRISVLQAMEDITEQVEASTRGKSDSEANEARKAALTRLEKACEERGEGLACESVNLYRGGQYFLYKYRRFDEVRLAFAPDLPIAAFGGDPDNFNFPRWCLDMAMLRVYDNGAPASIESYLPLRRSGPAEGEAVFVAGHPGSTDRLMTVSQLEHLRASTLPQRLLLYSELRGRMKAWARTGDEPARIVQQRILNIENAIKVWRNELAALSDDGQMARKQASEDALRQAVADRRKLSKAYGSAWGDVDRALASYRQFEDRYRFIEGAYGFRGSLFNYARTLLRGTAERERPNTERLREYRDTALPRVEQRLLAAVPVNAGFEQLQLAFSLEKLREWLGPDDPTVRAVLGDSSPDDLAQRLVEGSKLADVDYRRTLWEGGVAAVTASDDPMLALTRQIDAESRALRQRHEDEVEAVLDAASEKIARARFAIGGTDVYPDATFTLRVSYGSVQGWDERGEQVPPFTRVARLFERSTGRDPFRLPESWQRHGRRLDPGQPFNLVATTDIIGGNSGSPMIDAQGRIVGLVFDGNIHSIAGAYWFDIERNRTVAVHSGLMLESMAKIYGAEALLNEITVVP
jgi:hypothetical protein